MYKNLMNELRKKGISQNALAAVIGCTEKTTQNKLHGKTEFRLSEVLKIKNELLPEFTLDYIFKHDVKGGENNGNRI